MGPRQGRSISAEPDQIDVGLLVGHALEQAEVSARQLRDVQGVLQISGALLDVAELRLWADHVGVRDLLERALADAGM